MKSITFLGAFLLLISIVLFYLTSDTFNLEELKLSHIMGIMGGVGIGLIIGGIVGYISKGSAIKEAKKRKEFKRLQKEKEELEKRNAAILVQKENKSDDYNDYSGL